IGGGRGADSAGVIANGTVSVDLSTSAVDSKSLGLQGFSVTGQAIAAATYTAGAAGATLTFNGPGFSSIAVQVDLSGATIANQNDLAAAFNVSLQAAG